MGREERIAKEVEGLAQVALKLVAERSGRLVRLTVRIPADFGSERFCRLMDARLADVGLDFVDLSVDATPGPLRIVAADFHAG